MERSNLNWRLYGSAFAANLLSFVAGNAYAWTSPVLPKLIEDDTEINPLGRQITAFEESCIVSILNLGATIGPIVACFFVDRIGRKKVLMATSIPVTISYIILAFTQTVQSYYFARFLLGFGIGCVYSVIPIYIGEIAEDKNRGALGCLMNVMYTTGTLFAFSVGPYVSIKFFSLICILPILLFFIIFGVLAPESPHYYILTGNNLEAQASLNQLRLGPILKEVEEISKHIEESYLVQNFSEHFNNKAVVKAFSIGTGLMVFQQFAGITVVISYMQSIFEASGSAISSDISSIIIGTINLLSNLITSRLVDRLGRRILLLISLIGTSTSQISLSFYFYFKTNGYDVSDFSWVPVTSLMFFCVTFSLGIGPVAWAMVGEIFPQPVKSIANTFTSVINIFCAFILTAFYPNLNTLIGISFSFLLFGIFCLFGVIFVALFIPETKGKSLQEIEILLGKTEYQPTKSDKIDL